MTGRADGWVMRVTRRGLGPWRMAALEVVFGTLFPRLAWRLRWPSRLGPRGLAVYVACNALLGFMVRGWAASVLAQVREERAALARRLGREPTEEELSAHLLTQAGERRPGDGVEAE